MDEVIVEGDVDKLATAENDYIEEEIVVEQNEDDIVVREEESFGPVSTEDMMMMATFAKPFKTDQQDLLPQRDIIEILSNPDSEWLSTEAPVKPVSGEVYLFDTRAIEEYGQPLRSKTRRMMMRCDCYRWEPKGSKELKGGIMRNYHWSADPGAPRLGNPVFRKVDFWLKGDEQYMLVHYLGDHTKALFFPHRNNKANGDPFIRSKPITRYIKKMQEEGVAPETILLTQEAQSHDDSVISQDPSMMTTPIFDPSPAKTPGPSSSKKKPPGSSYGKVRGRRAKRPKPGEVEAFEEPPILDTSDMSVEELQRMVLEKQLRLVDRELTNQTKFTQVLQRVDTFMDRVEVESSSDMWFPGVPGARQATMPSGERVYVVSDGDDEYIIS